MDSFIMYDEDNDECSQSLLNGLVVPANKFINLPSTSNSPTLLGRMARYDEEKDIEKVSWLEPATKLLISLVQELRPKVGKSVKLKTKKKMWECIQEKIAAHGYIFTATQVENKYKSLERSYKNKLQHNKKTGRDRVSCQYEKELNHVFKGRDNIFPQYTLEATGTGTTQKELEEEAGIQQEEEIESMNTSTTAEEEFEGPKQKKIKIQANSTLKELSLIRKEKNEYNVKKLEAYEKRTAEIKIKNKLFEELIKVLSKKE